MRRTTFSSLLLWIASHCFLAKTAAAVHLNIITIILGEDPNYGWYATGPMYDIAFQHVEKFYPGLPINSTRHVLYQRNVTDCSAAAANVVAVAGQMFGLIDHSNGTTVIFSPGCSPEVMPLADFAREMDMLLLASTSSDVAFMNKQRFPTFVTFVPTGRGGMIPGLALFLRMYKWMTVSVFCESLLNYFSVASLFGSQCRAVKSLMMSPTSGFTVYYEDFDSVRNSRGFGNMLSRARDRSRIIVLVSRQDVVRKIMIRAHFMNMTSGDYVFLYPEPSRIPGFISLMDPTNDPHDEMATIAFEAMIALQFDPWETPRTARIFEEVAERSATFYNYTYRLHEMVNEYSLAAYDAVMVFADVLSQLFTEQLPPTQLNFRRRLLNHTFHTYSRNVSIGSDAYRLENVLFNRFNASTSTFDTGWMYNAAAGMIDTLSKPVADRWHGRTSRPPSEPACGFRGELCIESAIAGSTLGLLIVAGTLLLLLVPVSALVWTSRTRLCGIRINRLTFEDCFWIDDKFLTTKTPEVKLKTSICVEKNLENDFVSM